MDLQLSEKILAVLDSKTILEFYARDALAGKALKHNLKIPSPFRKERTPSFCFFKNDSGWQFYDHGDGSIKGSCFNYVMRLYNISFKDALKRVIADFNLDLENGKNRVRVQKVQNNKITKMKKQFTPDPKKQEMFNKVKTRDFSQDDLKYWQQFGITLEVLERYQVKSIESTPKKSSNGGYIPSITPKNQLCFGYFNETFVKVYKPLLKDKKYKFQFFGTKPPDFYFGYKQLPETGAKVFLVGGEKDALTMAANGYNALCLNSESANLPQNLMDSLLERFEHLIILYDTDETGIRQAKKLSKQYNLPMVKLPKMEKGGKDISDFVKLKNTQS